jgi:hypothetical protein
MARRYQGNMSGERYCGNASSKEVHDLDNEHTNCRIDEIIDAGNDRPFYTLAAAHAAGCDRSCGWCLRAFRT